MGHRQCILSALAGLVIGIGGCTDEGSSNGGNAEVNAMKTTAIADDTQAQAAVKTILEDSFLTGSIDDADFSAYIDDIQSWFIDASPKSMTQHKKQMRLPPALAEAARSSLALIVPELENARKTPRSPGNSSHGALATQTIACDDGVGSVSFNGKYQDDYNASIQLSYNGCRLNQPDIYYNATYKLRSGDLKLSISGNETSWSASVTLGNGDRDLNDENDYHLQYINSDNIVLAEINYSLTTKYSDKTKAATAQSSMLYIAQYTVDGQAEVIVNTSENYRHTTAFRGVSLQETDIAYSTSFDIDANGVIDYQKDNNQDESVEHGYLYGFSNYHYVYDNSAYYSTGNTSWEIGGKFAIARTPAQCGDGVYQVSTVSPVVGSGSGYSAGKLSINDASFSVLSPGLYEITTPAGTVQVNDDTLQNICLTL